MSFLRNYSDIFKMTLKCFGAGEQFRIQTLLTDFLKQLIAEKNAFCRQISGNDR
jgi:hypothetical protein